MTSQAIRKTVIADILAVLATGGLTVAFREGVKRSGDVLPAISVGFVQRDVSITHEDSGATGFWRVDLMIDLLSHVQDDGDTATINAMEKDVLDILNTDGIVTSLSNASFYNTYKALSRGATDEYIEGSIRHLGLSLTVRMCPTNATTTTTTTTTTT